MKQDPLSELGDAPETAKRDPRLLAGAVASAILLLALTQTGCRSFGPYCFPASKCGSVVELVGPTPGMQCRNGKTGRYERCP